MRKDKKVLKNNDGWFYSISLLLIERELLQIYIASNNQSKLLLLKINFLNFLLYNHTVYKQREIYHFLSNINTFTLFLFITLASICRIMMNNDGDHISIFVMDLIHVCTFRTLLFNMRLIVSFCLSNIFKFFYRMRSLSFHWDTSVFK